MDPTSGLLTINEITLALGAGIAPFAAAFITILLALIIKDMIASIAKGIGFKLGSKFKESDHVLLDDEKAIIVKIGLLTSVFGVIKDDGTYCWRYIPNQRIGYIKLEKIIIRDGDQMKSAEWSKNPVFNPENKEG